MTKTVFLSPLCLAALMAAVWTAPVQAEANADRVHAAARPFDAHSDIPDGFDPAHGGGEGQVTLELAQKGGLRGAALAVFAPQEGDSAEFMAKARAIADKKDGAIHALADLNPKQAAIADSGRFCPP
jgi:hypothetical protein